MIIKKIVTVALVSSIALMGIMLIIGLAVPKSVLDKLSREKTDTNTVIAVDANGKPIQGATVKINANGEATVVNASGQQVAGATAAAAPKVANTTQSTTATPNATVSTSPAPSTPSTTTPSTPTTPPSAPTTPPVVTKPAPTIGSFSASPTSIAYNASSTLSWASANATSCSMSPGGAVAASGSKATGALTASTTFTLTCSGSGTATKQTTVSVASAPPAAPSCGSPGGACTASQVATHNSAGNCWVIYSGSYYIVTSYVNRHNGGSGAFTSSTCGHDITAYMNGTTNAGTSVSKKNHSSGAYATLNSYKVGAVN